MKKELLERVIKLSKIKIFSLGGLAENGKNCYVIDIDNDIFVFDCGLKYATSNLFGIDYIMPDFSYLEKNKNRIKNKYRWRIIAKGNVTEEITIVINKCLQKVYENGIGKKTNISIDINPNNMM